MKRLLIILWSVILAVCLVLLSACTTKKYVTVPVTHTDTLYVTNHQRDSINVRDSIYIKDRGDTVWIERWHTKYVERLRTDTLIEHLTDTVSVPVEVQVEVPRRLTWWQQTRIHAGELLFALLIGGAAFAVWRLKRK